MRLTASELRGLLPLLRPGVEIEIVLHELPENPDVGETTPPTPRRRRKSTGTGRQTRWTPEARAEHGKRLLVAKQRKREEVERKAEAERAAAAKVVSQMLTETPASSREIKVQAFAEGGTPDQIQTAMLKAEVARMRSETTDGGVK